MKVKVADNVKGEILIKAINKTCKAGTIISMTDEQFWSEATQWAVGKGILSVEEGSDPSKKRSVQGKKIRNVYKNTIALEIIKRSIAPNEVIFLSNEQLEDNQVNRALDSGMLIYEPDKIILTPVNTEKEPTPSTIASSVMSSKKTIKRIGSENKETTKNILSVASNIKSVLKKVGEAIPVPSNTGSLASTAKPKMNAYIRRPVGADVHEPPKMAKRPRVVDRSQKDSILLDLDAKDEETGNNKEIT